MRYDNRTVKILAITLIIMLIADALALINWIASVDSQHVVFAQAISFQDNPTASATATATSVPKAKATRTPKPKTKAKATADTHSLSDLTAVNGIAPEKIIVMDETVAKNVQKIYQRGLKLGRDPHAFSKVGDSNIENPLFLTRFDSGPYNLGDYAYLSPVIKQFAGSFSRESMAVRLGLHSWSVFDPMWADKTQCKAAEAVLACEFRLHNPSIVFILLGSNDAGLPDYYKESLQKIIDTSSSKGVIPILATIAESSQSASDLNNQIIHQMAIDNQIPLWDFNRVAATLPGNGLESDGVHLTSFYAHDYTQEVAFQRGHGMQNLTALMALYQVWRVASAGG
jgi:hypothetical protein